MPDILRLIAASGDMHQLLTGALAERGIAHEVHGKMVVIGGAPERVIALLRSVLSGPEREAVSVVEELNFPHEFPVTTRLEAWWSLLETSWFEKALDSNSFSVWFQPVVDTTMRRIVGHECLLRLTEGRRREGAEIMAAASARRDLRTFDAYTRHLAIRSISSQLASGAMCFLNFIPSAMYRPSCCMRETMELLKETNLQPGNIVMEAIDSTGRPDIGHLRRISNYFREQGLGFSLDDVGDNAEAVRLICELRPDYIKLDRHLVNCMDQPRRAAAIRRLVELAERLGVRVVAKGVERVSTMERLWAAGVQCMQGYLLGCPAPEMSGGAMDLAHLTRAIQPSGQPEGVGLITA